jgi:hypothetical protein
MAFGTAAAIAIVAVPYFLVIAPRVIVLGRDRTPHAPTRDASRA